MLLPSCETEPLNKVVLAYSGGLDTSVAVAWLREQYGVEVVTLTVDLGGGSLRPGVAERAHRAGRHPRLRRRRARRASSRTSSGPASRPRLYQGAYPLATALARPLIAQLLVEVAERERADAVAHGCTGKGNDQVRFDVAVQALDPELEVIAPMRVGMGLSRDQEIDYASERGIEIPVTQASPYSVDVNLWGRSIETGVLEDPGSTPPARRLRVDGGPASAPASPAEITIGFDGGMPGRARRRADRARRARRAAERARRRARRRSHRPRRGSPRRHQEPRDLRGAGGRRSLHAAHRALEGLTLSKEQLRFNRLVARRDRPGHLRRALVQRAAARPARVRRARRSGSSTARSGMRLDHGTADRSSGGAADDSLYDRALATYDTGDAFDHAAARSASSASSGCRCGRRPARHGSAWSRDRANAARDAAGDGHRADARRSVGRGDRDQSFCG